LNRGRDSLKVVFLRAMKSFLLNTLSSSLIKTGRLSTTGYRFSQSGFPHRISSLLRNRQLRHAGQRRSASTRSGSCRKSLWRCWPPIDGLGAGVHSVLGFIELRLSSSRHISQQPEAWWFSIYLLAKEGVPDTVVGLEGMSNVTLGVSFCLTKSANLRIESKFSTTISCWAASTPNSD
jgi:hypothetical protein